jgi:hypothetical protein
VVTSPSGFGANVVLIAPVVASNAARLRRASTGPPDAAWIWVNRPPIRIVLPTWTIDLTDPSSTFGVKLAGSALTTRSCGTWTACAPCAGTSQTVIAVARASSTEQLFRTILLPRRPCSTVIAISSEPARR